VNLLCRALIDIAEHSNVTFSSGYFYDNVLALYKKFMLVAPAVSLVTGLPLSIYGVGTFQWKRVGKWKRFFLKFRNAIGLSRYANSVEGLDLMGDYDKDFFLQQFREVYSGLLERGSGEGDSPVAAFSLDFVKG
jgi:hypothetical protein